MGTFIIILLLATSSIFLILFTDEEDYGWKILGMILLSLATLISLTKLEDSSKPTPAIKVVDPKTQKVEVISDTIILTKDSTFIKYNSDLLFLDENNEKTK